MTMLMGSRRRVVTYEVKAMTEPKITRYPQAIQAERPGWAIGSPAINEAVRKPKAAIRC